ncbi:hypothetical protein F5Y03DRAFT_343351 [Xylaria venustula]|nr:hypothetical protein F5Y03DRAFT_343351 [Xylaria venustula]
MRPYDPIPLPSRAARDSAVRKYNKMNRYHSSFTREFETKFYAWQRTWYWPGLIRSGNARDRCDVAEFGKLVDMGPDIVPLVVYRLLDKSNFTAVFLCKFHPSCC